MIEQLFANAKYQAAKQLLDVAALRHEALAANLANIETPGYKRVDLSQDFTRDFASYLRGGGVAPKAKIAEDTEATSTRKDGNTVELDRELLALGKNSAEFDVLTEFVSGSIKQLRLAITGRNS
jgi:flagellar basal-body rod protein FlgB